MPLSLSVIIITKNEADNIEHCLNAVQWADEIIVVDSGSTDDTLAICRRYTQRVYSTDDWPGYGPQKNRALAYATSDWVLSIDADEIVTPELADEIKALLSQKLPIPYSVYAIPRRSEYCGRVLYHGDWGADYCRRLFKRGTIQFKPIPVHESLLFEGQPGKLNGILLHKTYRDLHEMLSKLNEYTTLSARHHAKQGKKGSLRKAILHGLWTFFRNYFIRRGFLDGAEGFICAVSCAENSYYRYLKLRQAKRPLVK